MNLRMLLGILVSMISFQPVFCQSINIFLEDTSYKKVVYDEKCIDTIVCKSKHTKFDNYNNFVCLDTISFWSAIFKKYSNFEGGHFYKTAYFSSSFFMSDANFRFTMFEKKATFSNANFYLEAVFEGARFKGECNFQNVVFQSPAKFTRSNFDNLANFSNVQFNEDAIFSGDSFKRIASFKEVHFFKNLDLSYSLIGSADFSSATFDSLASFMRGRIIHKLNLSNIRISDRTRFIFKQTVLPDSITLSNNEKFSQTLSTLTDFTLCNFLEDDFLRDNFDEGFWNSIRNQIGRYFRPSSPRYTYVGRHLINLYNTDVSKIKMDYTHFKLYFEDEEAFHSNEGSDSILVNLPSNDAISSVYEGLLKNFRDRGQIESYKRLDIEYRRYKNGLSDNDFSFEDWWWRFGYEKWRIFVHSGLFILLFFGYNFFRITSLNNKEYGPFYLSDLPKFISEDGERANNYYRKRLWASFAYTCVLFFSLPIKLDKIRFSNIRGSAWIVFIYLIGLFCMAYIANFILQR